jgi:hypothetical protein
MKDKDYVDLAGVYSEQVIAEGYNYKDPKWKEYRKKVRDQNPNLPAMRDKAKKKWDDADDAKTKEDKKKKKFKVKEEADDTHELSVHGDRQAADDGSAFAEMIEGFQELENEGRSAVFANIKPDESNQTIKVQVMEAVPELAHINGKQPGKTIILQVVGYADQHDVPVSQR